MKTAPMHAALTLAPSGGVRWLRPANLYTSACTARRPAENRLVPYWSGRIPPNSFVIISFEGRLPSSLRGHRTFLTRAKNEVLLEEIRQIQHVGGEEITLGWGRKSSCSHFQPLTAWEFGLQLSAEAEKAREIAIYKMILRKGSGLEDRVLPTVVLKTLGDENVGFFNQFLSSLYFLGGLAKNFLFPFGASRANDPQT